MRYIGMHAASFLSSAQVPETVYERREYLPGSHVRSDFSYAYYLATAPQQRTYHSGVVPTRIPMTVTR